MLPRSGFDSNLIGPRSGDAFECVLTHTKNGIHVRHRLVDDKRGTMNKIFPRHSGKWTRRTRRIEGGISNQSSECVE